MQLWHQFRVKELLGPRRARDVRAGLHGGLAFVGVVAALKTFLALGCW